MEVKTVKGLKQCIALFERAPVPIQKTTAKVLTEQIKAGESLAALVHTIERDPALCFHVLVEANKRNQNPDVEILSLSHVITLLGMQGLIDCVKAAPKLKVHKSDAYQKAYLQAQSNSMFAGRLIEYWAEQCSQGSPEKLKWATVIAGAPTWILWQEAYGQMRKRHWQIEHQRTFVGEAEKAIFGCGLDDICYALGRKLRLPNSAVQVLDGNKRPTLQQWGRILSDQYLDYFDNEPKLRHLKSSPLVLMAVITVLAEQVPSGWMRQKAKRAQIMLSHLSGKSLEQVISQNHRLAVEFSQGNVLPNVVQPATSLLWPKQSSAQKVWLRQAFMCIQEHTEDALPVKESSEASKNHEIHEIQAVQEAAPPRQANTNVLMKLITQFNKQVASFENIHDILLTCNKAIYEGIGMRRTFVCILNKTGDVLRPLYCVGIEDDSPVRTLSIKLATNRFFGKLLASPASFKVESHNYPQVCKMLGTEVVDTLANENFMVMSLFANGKPIGVVYADASAAEDRISEKEYQAFKKICQSASFALDSYSQKRRQASAK